MRRSSTISDGATIRSSNSMVWFGLPPAADISVLNAEAACDFYR